MNPAQRTYELLKMQGWEWLKDFDKTESYNSFTHQRKDLFHIIDVLLLKDGFIGLQICGTDFAPHIKKMTIDYAEQSKNWINNGGRLILIGWRKLKKKRGGKAYTWAPRIVEFDNNLNILPIKLDNKLFL